MPKDNTAAQARDYSHFTDELEEHQLRRHNANIKVNELHMELENTRGQRQQAVLAGDEAKVEELTAACEQLETKIKYAQQDAEDLSRDGAFKFNNKARTIGKAVMDQNREKMAGFQKRWDSALEQFNGHKAAIYELVCELGRIEIEATKVRAQNQHIMEVTGLRGTWVSTPGGRAVNLLKNTGVIFFPVQDLRDRFLSPDKYKEDTDG